MIALLLFLTGFAQAAEFTCDQTNNYQCPAGYRCYFEWREGPFDCLKVAPPLSPKPQIPPSQTLRCEVAGTNQVYDFLGYPLFFTETKGTTVITEGGEARAPLATRFSMIGWNCFQARIAAREGEVAETARYCVRDYNKMEIGGTIRRGEEADRRIECRLLP